MSRRSPLAVATIACFVLGIALMLPFEATLTRVLGVAALLAFIVCGVFWIADPRALADGDEAAGELPGRAAQTGEPP
jgi:hypothetical protein